MPIHWKEMLAQLTPTPAGLRDHWAAMAVDRCLAAPARCWAEIADSRKAAERSREVSHMRCRAAAHIRVKDRIPGEERIPGVDRSRGEARTRAEDRIQALCPTTSTLIAPGTLATTLPDVTSNIGRACPLRAAHRDRGAQCLARTPLAIRHPPGRREADAQVASAVASAAVAFHDRAMALRPSEEVGYRFGPRRRVQSKAPL